MVTVANIQKRTIFVCTFINFRIQHNTQIAIEQSLYDTNCEIDIDHITHNRIVVSYFKFHFFNVFNKKLIYINQSHNLIKCICISILIGTLLL